MCLICSIFYLIFFLVGENNIQIVDTSFSSPWRCTKNVLGNVCTNQTVCSQRCDEHKDCESCQNGSGTGAGSRGCVWSSVKQQVCLRHLPRCRGCGKDQKTAGHCFMYRKYSCKGVVKLTIMQFNFSEFLFKMLFWSLISFTLSSEPLY